MTMSTPHPITDNWGYPQMTFPPPPGSTWDRRADRAAIYLGKAVGYSAFGLFVWWLGAR